MVAIDKIEEKVSSILDENVSNLHKVQDKITQKTLTASQLSDSPQKMADIFAPKINLKRIKRLLLIFLKQFDVDEFKYLIKFLEILFIKYADDPLKIFVYLTHLEAEKAYSTIDNNKKQVLITPLDEEEVITYLDEYKSDIIESFLMKDNDEELTESQVNKSQNNEELSEYDQEDNFDDFNYYYHNRENENDEDYDENDDDVNKGEKNESDEDVALKKDSKITNKKNSNGTAGNIRVRKFSERIRTELERKFLKNNFISGPEKTKLAKLLNLSERQVQKWFVHRREKLRRRTRDEEVCLKDDIDSQLSPEESGCNELKDQNEKSLNGELIHEDEEAGLNKRRSVARKNSLIRQEMDNSSSISANRSLRPKQIISYDEEPLKTPPAKRKCNASSRVTSYLETVFHENKFLKDKQIVAISRETGMAETQIREWFKERSLKSSSNESHGESRSRRRVSRNAF